MDLRELLFTGLRALAVYILMLVVVRALGKRTIGNFAPFDLLVALMIGELVDEIIYADVSFLQGTLAIVVIAAAQAGNSWLTWWGHGFDTLLEGTPTVIVRDGKLDQKGMRSELMNQKEVMGHLRSTGIRDLREVKLALVEDDGSVSVVRRRWAEPAVRADVDEAAASERTSDTNGKNEPESADRTDAPEWLK
jgi:uncharacterized membrane protein YcaP (DUF421 family)